MPQAVAEIRLSRAMERSEMVMGVDVGASFKIGADPSRRNGENPVPARFSEREALAGRH